MRIKVKHKDREKEIVLQKAIDSWVKNNKGMIEDIMELNKDVQMFEIKWGIKLKLEIDGAEVVV